MIRPFDDPGVQAAFDAFPTDVRDMALTLRDLIFSVAWDTPQVGRVDEMLKWGQPAYLTPETKAGSTLRIGMASEGGAALFAHCATDIISTYATTFPGTDHIAGNRAVIFRKASDIVPARLRLLIFHGLTYHLDRRR